MNVVGGAEDSSSPPREASSSVQVSCTLVEVIAPAAWRGLKRAARGVVADAEVATGEFVIVSNDTTS